MLSIYDEDHSDDETHDERWITLGQDSHGVILTVIHTFREINFEEWLIRIISARKATRSEIKQYKGG